MMLEKPINILATGKYLPKQILSEDIEQAFGIPPGWSEKYSGVVSRHHVTIETNGFMGARAIEEALQKANLKLHDIDLILSAGATFDYPLPNQSSIIKHELKGGLEANVPTIDIDSSCLSFLSAFEIASCLLDGKRYKKIIIVSSEIASKGLDPSNWETITLFGDAAVAVILEYNENSGSAFIKSEMKTYSEGTYDSIIRGGGNVYFFKDNPYAPALHSFAMNGKHLLKLAMQKLPEFINLFFSDTHVSIQTTDIIIPHQASKLGISVLSNLYSFTPKQVKGNLRTRGNCIAASIPLVLHETIENQELKRGDTCFLIGTAAGFSIGGLLFRY